MKEKIIARLREPSTYAGIAATILIIPTPSAMALAGTVKVVGAAIAGILAIWMPENKA
jgi:hypothetical protein